MHFPPDFRSPVIPGPQATHKLKKNVKNFAKKRNNYLHIWVCVIFKHIFIFALSVNMFRLYLFLLILNESQTRLFIYEIEMILRSNKQTTMIKWMWLIWLCLAKKLTWNHLIIRRTVQDSFVLKKKNIKVPGMMRSILRSPFFFYLSVDVIYFPLFILHLTWMRIAELPNKGVRRTFLFYFIQQWPNLYQYYYT